MVMRRAPGSPAELPAASIAKSGVVNRAGRWSGLHPLPAIGVWGMTQRTLGTLTIGQAPRLDVVPIIARHVPAEIRRVHRGVLDGLSSAEISARYGAESGEPAL